ncbi:MAG: MFS transporter, partial [Acidobacteriaceae bacterium]
MSLATSIAEIKQSDRRWWVLVIVVAAQFMFVVDAFIVNVAIPSIRADLHATTGEIQGVIVLYQIVFATLIITGGRLGDIRGSKPMFLLGILGFTLASLWCGLARSGGELVTARAVQGGAAALMIPQVLATIHLLFRDGERGRAFGIYGCTLGFGGAVGFGLGGLLVALNLGDLGWRTIFFVNVPIGLVLMGAALWLMPSPAGKPGTRLDLIGAVVLLVALLCLIGPLLLGADLEWAPWLFAVMAAGGVLIASMWPLERWVEHGRKGLPLIHLDLLRDRSFATGLAAVFFFT